MSLPSPLAQASLWIQPGFGLPRSMAANGNNWSGDAAVDATLFATDKLKFRGGQVPWWQVQRFLEMAEDALRVKNVANEVRHDTLFGNSGSLTL